MVPNTVIIAALNSYLFYFLLRALLLHLMNEAQLLVPVLLTRLKKKKSFYDQIVALI